MRSDFFSHCSSQTLIIFYVH